MTGFEVESLADFELERVAALDWKCWQTLRRNRWLDTVKYAGVLRVHFDDPNEALALRGLLSHYFNEASRLKRHFN